MFLHRVRLVTASAATIVEDLTVNDFVIPLPEAVPLQPGEALLISGWLPGRVRVERVSPVCDVEVKGDSE